MKLHAIYVLFWLVLGSLLAGHIDANAQETELFLDITGMQQTGIKEDPRTGSKTVLLQVRFRAWYTEARGNEFNGSLSLDYIRERLKCNGKPASVFNGPQRFASETDPMPMVFLLAIDVSGSMGGPGPLEDEYQRRMKQVETALRGFVDNIENNPAIYVRLYPWGHLVPFSVNVEGEEQRLDMWEGRYLPLDDQGKEALRQGIHDINLFVQKGDRNVNTALYGVCKQGVQELQQTVQLKAQFKKAKPVLVVLTDGENDPQLASTHFQELSLSSLTDELDSGRLSGEKASVPVYTIAFGLDSQEARNALKQISGVTRARSYEVADGAEAAGRLEEVYNELVEFEGNTWWVEIDTRTTRKDIALGKLDINFGPPVKYNDRMLLLPSARADLKKGYLGIALAISGVILIILINLWYFTRPKELDEEDERAGVAHEEEEGAGARSGGVRISEYLNRRKHDDEDG